MNHHDKLDRLSNRYFAMRHGHSLANQRGIIVSHPEHGCSDFGLSEDGLAQVKASLQQDRHLGAATLIVSSDFKRALETATLVRRLADLQAPVDTDARLRERYFGELELGADSAYPKVWREDVENPDSQFRAAESVNQVMTRVTALILDLERRYADADLLLVSHGDALQILQAAFARQCASTHRQLPHLHTAEIRPLLLG